MSKTYRMDVRLVIEVDDSYEGDPEIDLSGEACYQVGETNLDAGLDLVHVELLAPARPA